MAVARSYLLVPGPNFDLSGPATGPFDATSLSDGSFVVLGDHASHTDFDFFAADLVGGSTTRNGTNGSVDQLTNGNIVFAFQDANSILFGVMDTSGDTVVNTIDIGDEGSSNADVAALANGGFVIVSQDYFGGTDFDIDISIRTATGALVNSITVDTTSAMDTNASVAGLSNGNFVVVWQRAVGAETEVWRAIYSPTGAVVVPAAAFDASGTINRSPNVISYANGFAVVYESNGWSTGTSEITLARFSNAGVSQGFTDISNPTNDPNDSPSSNPAVTLLDNNMLVVAYTELFLGDDDTRLALFDLTTLSRLALGSLLAGEAGIDEVINPVVAAFGTGQIAVAHRNVTDNDADGGTFTLRRISTSDAAGDLMLGDSFIDTMHGNSGADTMWGAGNDDTLGGGAGNDFIAGENGNDFLFGGADNDIMGGGPGNDWMEGSDGADTLLGGDGNDRIDGGAGNDVLEGQAGIDVAIGGPGDDNYTVDNAGDGVFENPGEGNDTIFASVSYEIRANVEVLALSGAGNINAFGNAAANTLIGNGGNNSLYGYGGNDWMEANGGADWLIGGDGSDRLDGGAGNDVLEGQSGTDILIGGAGGDTYRYNSAADSNVTTGFDYIFGFEHGIDKLVVARQGAADTFTFQLSGADSVFWVDYGGNGSLDLAVVLIGVQNATALDVILA